jgi:Tfp pilus assembly protein PilO
VFKRILAATIIILIAVAYVQWGMDYIYAYEWDKTAPDRQSLVNDVANMKKIVSKPVTVDETLVQKAAALQAQVKSETELFPASVDITGVVDQLLHLAKDTGIGIIPLRNGEWTDSREDGYQEYQIQLLITGDIDDIVSFVNKVEGTMLNSLRIDSLDMSGDSILPAATDNGTGAVDGNITITVYARV